MDDEEGKKLSAWVLHEEYLRKTRVAQQQPLFEKPARKMQEAVLVNKDFIARTRRNPNRRYNAGGVFVVTIALTN